MILDAIYKETKVSIDFIYPSIRTNPEYKFDEVLSGYNYNFSLLENFNELTGITISGDLIVSGTGIFNSLTATTFSGGTIYSGDTNLSLLFGNFNGPTASTQHAIVKFTDTTGKHGDNTGIIINDANAISGITGMDIALDSVDSVMIDGSTNLRGVTIGAIRQLHTPSIPGTRAYNFQINTNGFADTKAIEVNYTSESFLDTDQASVFNINIDKDEATGGKIDALRVAAVGTTATTIHALHAGTQVSPINHHSGNFVNMDVVFSADPTFAVFTDVTSSFTSTTVDSVMFENYQDYIVIGHSEQYTEISFNLDTVTTNPGVLPSFEYSTGGTNWATFSPIDNTNGFRQNGSVTYEVPDAWSADTVNGISGKYWIRIRREKTGNLSVLPIENHVQVSVSTEFYWDRDGDIRIRNIDALNVSGTTIDGGTILSGGTDLYNIFLTSAPIGDITRVQPGTNTYTGGTDNLPTINVSALTINSLVVSGNTQLSATTVDGLLSATTLDGQTLLSGGTDLYNVFALVGSGDVTRVQPGTNITTGGTENFPVVNLSDDVAINSLSATTLSGGTIYSGGTDLYNIFLTSAPASDVTRIQLGTNTYTGGTDSLPTINVSALTINSLVVSGNTQLSATTVDGLISATTVDGQTLLSGGTDLYNIFLTSVPSGDITRVQPGTNIATGGTGNIPVVNLSDNVVISSLSATTLSGGTIYSGGTDLYNIFAPTGLETRVVALEDLFSLNINFEDVIEYNFIAPYDFKINTITGTTEFSAVSVYNVTLSASTTTGTTINQYDSLIISANTVGLVVLDSEKL